MINSKLLLEYLNKEVFNQYRLSCIKKFHDLLLIDDVICWFVFLLLAVAFKILVPTSYKFPSKQQQLTPTPVISCSSEVVRSGCYTWIHLCLVVYLKVDMINHILGTQ